MKIKTDFVTNSSSTSFMISGQAKFNLNGIGATIYKYGKDVTTLDMLKMIEGEIQYFYKIKTPFELTYFQTVDEIQGDGWDGGDYSFSGAGHIFFGVEEILNKVMNKKDVNLKFDGEKLEIPVLLIEECTETYIAKEYKDLIEYAEE